MAASRLSSFLAVAAAVASISAAPNCTRADAPSFFSFLSTSSQTSSSSSNPATQTTNANKSEETQEPTGSRFDPEGLERGARALRKINSSPIAKQAFDVMRKQEETWLAELDAEKAHYEAIQAQADIYRQRKMAEEQRNLVQQQAQVEAQQLRYEDELARKRIQTDHEAQMQHNLELVKTEEESSIQKEQARRATEEQIQAQHHQTEKERAEIERETIRVKAMAEAEAQAHEAKLTEDHYRRMLIERIHGEKDKWLAAINTTFSHVEEGFRTLLTDRNKLIMTVGGATALAAGIYTTREGARVTWGYINRILGQPSLIQESSIAKFPWSGLLSQARNKIVNNRTTAGAARSLEVKIHNEDIVLHPSLQRRI